MGDILLSMGITIGIYTVPIVIYRFVIKGESVDKRKAKIIAIIYGIVAMFVMTFIKLFIFNQSSVAGGAIVFWSFINYGILISGQKSVLTSENKFDDIFLKLDANMRKRCFNDLPENAKSLFNRFSFEVFDYDPTQCTQKTIFDILNMCCDIISSSEDKHQTDQEIIKYLKNSYAIYFKNDSIAQKAVDVVLKRKKIDSKIDKHTTIVCQQNQAEEERKSDLSNLEQSNDKTNVEPNKPKNIKTEEEDVIFKYCRKCGNELVNNGAFCHKCGTKIK